MQLSPLQLLKYDFEGVSIKSVTEYKADTSFSPGLVFFPGNLSIAADTGYALIEETDAYSDFGIKLGLRVGPKLDNEAPYVIDIGVHGVVRMHFIQNKSDLAEDRRQRAVVNGISLLYGVAREMVSTITSRAIHGLMLLPALNFSDLANISFADRKHLPSRESSNAMKLKKTSKRVPKTTQQK